MLSTAVRWALITTIASSVAQARVMNLSDLDGRVGFLIASEGGSDRLGYAASNIGDINGDGFDDVAIGAIATSNNGYASGSAYVVYGQPQSVRFPGRLELSDLNGSNGFRLDGEDVRDWAGRAVSSAGDINGDGLPDLIIGASRVDANGANSGRSYVIFGRSADDAFPALIQLGSLDGGRGFALNGVAEDDNSGRVTAAVGDINGDGVDDLAIGASGSDPNGSASGSTYVLFGNSTPGAFPPRIELAQMDGTNGFTLEGVEPISNSGSAVSGAGDFNADGIDDLLIGAALANGSGTNPIRTGSAYVIFGRAPTEAFPATMSLSNFETGIGVRINGEVEFGRFGFTVDGGADVNGDGNVDLIIGAYRTSFNGDGSGSAYVVFGGPDVIPDGAVLEVSGLNGSNGFRIDGLAAFDEAGRSVALPGDYNSDGIDDLVVAAGRSRLAGVNAGSTYLIYGRPSSDAFDAIVDLAALADSEGLRIDGVEFELSGLTVSGAGDVNSDGVADLLISALGTSPGGRSFMLDLAHRDSAEEHRPVGQPNQGDQDIDPPIRLRVFLTLSDFQRVSDQRSRSKPTPPASPIRCSQLADRKRQSGTDAVRRETRDNQGQTP